MVEEARLESPGLGSRTCERRLVRPQRAGAGTFAQPGAFARHVSISRCAADAGKAGIGGEVVLLRCIVATVCS